MYIKACSNEANIMQHCWPNNDARCWTKILSRLNLKPTSFNIIQHVVQTRPTCLNRPLYYTGQLYNKQLLNEVEHDIENYQGRGCVIHRSRRLRWITHTEALIILDIMRKPSSIVILLCIQNQNKEQYKWNTRKFHAKLILAMFLKQLNDGNQSFKLMKINISSTTCRSVL